MIFETEGHCINHIFHLKIGDQPSFVRWHALFNKVHKNRIKKEKACTELLPIWTKKQTHYCALARNRYKDNDFAPSKGEDFFFGNLLYKHPKNNVYVLVMIKSIFFGDLIDKHLRNKFTLFLRLKTIIFGHQLCENEFHDVSETKIQTFF